MTDAPRSFRERYPGPYTIVEHEESFCVMRGETRLAYIYFEDEDTRRHLMKRLTRAEAAALAQAIAGLGEREAQGE